MKKTSIFKFIGIAFCLINIHAFSQTTSWNSNGSYRIQTLSNGNLDIGPANSGFCHFVTDRNIFYFSKGILVQGGVVSSYSGGDLLLGTGSGSSSITRMKIISGSGDVIINKNIGIGVASAAARLDVGGIQAMNDNAIYLRSGVDPYHGLKYAGSSFASINIDGPVLWGYNAGALGCNTGGVQKISLYWNNSGAVAIGGTKIATGSKLSVNGHMYAEKVYVKLMADWPDYVFDKKYKLTSLSEVEQYIKLNKRLPGMPAASEIKEKGIDVADIQVKQMQKIEELTLYIIELQKQINELKNK